MAAEQVNLEQAVALAAQHHQAGRLREAEIMYRQVLTRQPNHPDALRLLGLLALQVGQSKVALDLLGRALAAGVNTPEIHNDLGNAHCGSGEFSRAEGAFRRAIALRPDYPECWYNLGNALMADRRTEEAIDAFGKALSLRPDLAESHINLGNALHETGQIERALEHHRAAAALRPADPAVQVNLGHSLRGVNRIDEAIEAYRKALSLAPDWNEAEQYLGQMLLMRGDFVSGWRHYDRRPRTNEDAEPVQELPGTPWDGRELSGRQILLQVEQGFGDAIQFVRFAPLVAERGGKVILRCYPPLARLFATVEGVERIVTTSDPRPRYDVYCWLPSLPRALGSTLETISSRIAYLHPEATLSSAWRRRVPEGRLKVGLAWAGRATHTNDRNRSVDPNLLAPLAEVAGVQLVSLQKERPGLTAPTNANWFLDWTDELRDFADTAALIDNLDLVITVDTSIAHLSAALGKPTWILLPLAPDFRWMLDREDSLWYPTARLFRQSKIRDWQAPIARINESLRAMAARNGEGGIRTREGV